MGTETAAQSPAADPEMDRLLELHARLLGLGLPSRADQYRMHLTLGRSNMVDVIVRPLARGRWSWRAAPDFGIDIDYPDADTVVEELAARIAGQTIS
jgi:hypothetical protein